MTDVDILSIVAHRQWLVLTGALLMALVVLGRTVAARAGLTGLADRVVSVASAYLSDLSWMLPAAGYDYWPWALVAALRGTLMSGGLAELIADLVKRRWPPVAVVGLLLVALGGTGCGAENRCLAERTTVTALGVALGMAEGLVPDGHEDAEQAIDIASASLLAGEVLVGSCEQIRDNARDWRAWLTRAVALVKAVLAIVAAAGVDIPQAEAQVIRLEQLASGAATPVAGVESYRPELVD